MAQPLGNIRQRALLGRKHTDCSDLYICSAGWDLAQPCYNPNWKRVPLKTGFGVNQTPSTGHTMSHHPPVDLFMLLLHADATTSGTSRNGALALERFDGELPSTLPWQVSRYHGNSSLANPMLNQTIRVIKHKKETHHIISYIFWACPRIIIVI